jgi:hypothetical protein
MTLEAKNWVTCKRLHNWFLFQQAINALRPSLTDPEKQLFSVANCLRNQMGILDLNLPPQESARHHFI